MELYFSYYIFHNVLLFYCFSCVFSGSVSMFVTTIDDLKILRKVDFLICLKMPVNFIQYCGGCNSRLLCFDKNTNGNKTSGSKCERKNTLTTFSYSHFFPSIPVYKKMFCQTQKIKHLEKAIFFCLYQIAPFDMGRKPIVVV